MYNAFVDEYVDYLKMEKLWEWENKYQCLKKYIERKNNIKNINM